MEIVHQQCNVRPQETLAYATGEIVVRLIALQKGGETKSGTEPKGYVIMPRSLMILTLLRPVKEIIERAPTIRIL